MIKVKSTNDKVTLKIKGNIVELIVDTVHTLQAMRNAIAKHDDEYGAVVFARVIQAIASDGVLFDDENLVENMGKRIMTVVAGLKDADSAEEDDEE